MLQQMDKQLTWDGEVTPIAQSEIVRCTLTCKYKSTQPSKKCNAYESELSTHLIFYPSVLPVLQAYAPR